MAANNGKIGEQLFQQMMESRGYVVKDVSFSSDYWSKDIDFIVTSPTTGAVQAFEVKWDSRISQTGNLFLELTNIYSKGGKGWFKFCEADYLAYGDAVSRLFYIIPMKELRARVSELPQRIVNCGDDSTGLLISLGDLSDIIAVLNPS